MSDASDTPVNAEQCLGFKAGVTDGHMIENKSTEVVAYPELVYDKKGPRFLHGDGMSYPEGHQPKCG